ncbi:efflux RND transporter periplasmic adaptor subunit [Acidomonas methanolica]|uniref:Heavy metal/cation efflux pump CzcB/HlyD n=1 Tax=Acidomonas methanolica NBRC 104435 TaxID=1231351 RepID=A0A023D325_ACIMT|nr:efflux RND transporter periplasmic adaptor subunit [Acidomonas methanolica]TCS30714.1 cobalt-zinc-cadmium efflux system membrane fusion protein [Acidomonas methanolica]GAJ28155.1 heavy metal/cation efflux pump CzcB/HlyD [Acidomonas methanolica NBRC 104435]GBQ48675.1 cation efflux system protein CzcB [Acidomonas methanolica]GEK98898.1 hypothetical protein AME01nite_13970 [Acidomonas methanolica NBRC 104435]
MHSISARHQVLAIVLAFVLSAVIFGVVRHRRPPPGTLSPAMLHKRVDGAIVVADGAPLMSRLEIAPVTVETIPHGLRVPGIVRADPRRTLTIVAPVAGRVLSAPYRPGDPIRRGDVLALLAAGDFDQAWADLEKARAQLAYEEKVVHRAEGVLAVGGNAQKDLDSARNDYAQAEAELQRAQHRVDSLAGHAAPKEAAQAKTGVVPILSPVDGVVASTTLAPGQYVSDPTATLMTLLDLSTIWVEAAIPEDEAHAVHIGESARADFLAWPGPGCHGPLFTVDPTLTPDTRRLTARIACANTAMKLLPNMYADVTIDVPQPAEILVPKSALLMNNDALSVFLEIAPQTYMRRMVTVSYDEGDTVRVLTGLKAGDKIITRGGILINDN